MNTCRTCKHWDLQDERWGHGYNAGMFDKHHDCLRVHDGAHMESKDVRALPLDDAYAMDCEGYHAALFSGPDFACIKWEQRDA